VFIFYTKFIGAPRGIISSGGRYLNRSYIPRNNLSSFKEEVISISDLISADGELRVQPKDTER
jgi:hypothetical protein